ncbi:MAG: hypothetical protein N3H31_07345 [Candidatus Nezhaarchaeota archaeon]|nr:hypothetical protein [Candidatus Nezhaarchaeota archaeon]
MLSNTIQCFIDPTVGAVGCFKLPELDESAEVGKCFRDYYNLVRLVGSEVHSKIVFHGEFVALKISIKVGLPTDIGATTIALAGYGTVVQ